MDYIKAGCAFIAVLAFVLVIGFGIAVATGLMQLPLMNIQRQVTTHSQQYIQTHQTMLMGWYADYQSGDDAHKAAAKTEICTNVVLLDKTEWPTQIEAFVSQNCP